MNDFGRHFARWGTALVVAGGMVGCGQLLDEPQVDAPTTDRPSAMIAAGTKTGTRIQTTDYANIRNAPSINATMLGRQPPGALGTIVGGPITDTNGDKLTRYQINFDSGVDGWAAQDYLVVVSSGTSITVSPKPVTLPIGGTAQLTVKNSAGAVVSGTGATWTSRTPGIVTVSTGGLLKGIATGTAFVVVSASSKLDSVPVTVTAGGPVAAKSGHFVTPGGSSAGDGSASRPWDLRTALAGAGGKVRPGDTVWVRAGTYHGNFVSTVSGSPNAPVVIRAYPGERATIDGSGTSTTISILAVRGQNSVFWGLEISNSSPTRTTSALGNAGRSPAIANYASNTRYVNLVVHDGGVAFYTEPIYQNVEIAGCILYNNGWQAPDRGHGHGIYLKSNTGPVVARDNVIFNQFGYGIHVYSDLGTGKLNNIRLEGNVAFNNGTLATNSSSANILVGGEDTATGDVVQDNLTYFSPGVGGTNAMIGYASTHNGTISVLRNYFVFGSPVLNLGYWQSAGVSGNTLIGSQQIVTLNNGAAAGQLFSGNSHRRDPLSKSWSLGASSYPFTNWRSASHAASDAATGGLPTASNIVVRANPYEAGRAMVVVYNWGRSAQAVVKLPGVLKPGDPYVVRSVQNLYGTPVAQGTFVGTTLTIPLAGMAPPAPIGWSKRGPSTGIDFDTFIVSKY